MPRQNVTYFLTCLTVLTIFQLGSCDWGYVDQAGWSSLNDSSCGGRKQSPIDLPDVCDRNSRTKVNPRMNLHLINYDMDIPPSVLKMKNNGHTAVIQFRDSRTPNAWTPK